MSYQTDEYTAEDYFSWDEWADEYGDALYFWMWAEEEARRRNPIYRARLALERWSSWARNWFKRRNDSDYIPF